MKAYEVSPKSYFHEAANSPATVLFTFTRSPGETETAPFLREFFHLLETTTTSDFQWLVSLQGRLSRHSLLPVVTAAAAPALRCAYWLAEVSKPLPHADSNYTEISTLCDIKQYLALWSDQAIEFRADFHMGGWLVVAVKAADMVSTPKYMRGHFTMHRPFIAASFFSDEDFDHIVLSPFDPVIEKRIRCAVKALQTEVEGQDFAGPQN